MEAVPCPAVSSPPTAPLFRRGPLAPQGLHQGRTQELKKPQDRISTDRAGNRRNEETASLPAWSQETSVQEFGRMPYLDHNSCHFYLFIFPFPSRF